MALAFSTSQNLSLRDCQAKRDLIEGKINDGKGRTPE
jgi:hypothetical protein